VKEEPKTRNSKKEIIVAPTKLISNDEDSDFSTVKMKKKSSRSGTKKAPKPPPTINRYWDLVPEAEIRRIIQMSIYQFGKFEPMQYYSVAQVCSKIFHITNSLAFWQECLARMMPIDELKVKIYFLTNFNNKKRR
jgi:hypothetical protein